jgi:hypothetical protein
MPIDPRTLAPMPPQPLGGPPAGNTYDGGAPDTVFTDTIDGGTPTGTGPAINGN